MHTEGNVKQRKLPNNVQGLTPAQNHEVPSVCRGQMSERAIPELLNGEVGRWRGGEVEKWGGGELT